MKKITALLVITLFLLVGCGSEKPTDPVVQELSENHIGPATQPFSNGPSEIPGA